MKKPTPTHITLRAPHLELIETLMDRTRQPILITLGHDDAAGLDITVQTTAPDGADTLEYIGGLFTSLGQGLTAQAHTLTPVDVEEGDQ